MRSGHRRRRRRIEFLLIKFPSVEQDRGETRRNLTPRKTSGAAAGDSKTDSSSLHTPNREQTIEKGTSKFRKCFRNKPGRPQNACTSRAIYLRTTQGVRVFVSFILLKKCLRPLVRRHLPLSIMGPWAGWAPPSLFNSGFSSSSETEIWGLENSA